MSHQSDSPFFIVTVLNLLSFVAPYLHPILGHAPLHPSLPPLPPSIQYGLSIYPLPDTVLYASGTLVNKIEVIASWNIKSNRGDRYENGLFIAQLVITKMEKLERSWEPEAGLHLRARDWACPGATEEVPSRIPPGGWGVQGGDEAKCHTPGRGETAAKSQCLQHFQGIFTALRVWVGGEDGEASRVESRRTCESCQGEALDV